MASIGTLRPIGLRRRLPLALGLQAMHNRLSTAQVVCAAVYALIFPISNLIGGGLTMLGILLTFPFLILAWPGGMLAVAISGSEQAYLWGAGLAIFLQALAVTSLVKAFRGKAKA